ncbi:hypothetical protein THRCLA_04089 [Thraustotheca clavata]|uniref:BHLH domain-containing protein n=1 Tax=Thraustotheca clavata TaxID=74557 RepID=A0A1V9ZZY1_9STRA|nr:hypothetical protein THRCLA_04089 [Thraustotheca clavata]
MDFEDLSTMQIEDLGNLFNDHLGDENTDMGFSLGYSDEDNNSPKTPATTLSQDFHNVTASLLNLPNSPNPMPFQNQQVIDSTTLVFNEFSLEDRIAQHTKSKIHSMTNIEPIGMPPIFQNTISAQTSAEPAEISSNAVPTWLKPQASTLPPMPKQPPTMINTMKRPFAAMETCSSDSCSTIANNDEDDRGYRKKSREKMRRQEVNVKFDELTSLLGMNDKVRKSAVLQEAVNTIKSLRRERDEIRNDRDRLKQELSKLASCLQFSHMGNMANTMSMPQQLPTHPPTMPPPGVCFPIGSNFAYNFNPYANPPSQVPSTQTMSLGPPIAPKLESSKSVLLPNNTKN